MEWLSLDGVPWWSLLLAVVVTFALGWVWYSPMGFFPLWARLGKLTPEDMKSSNMAVAFGGTLAGNILGVVLLGVLISSLGVSGIWQGALLGGLIGLVFRGGAHAVHNGFAARHPGITLIDAAADTVSLAVAGAIIGAFV